MKNIKGFVMIETIIVITILTVGLISLYSSYSVILSKSKVKNNYDNIEYLYKTYFIGNYLVDNNVFSNFTIYKQDTLDNDLNFIIDNLSIDKIYVIPKNFDYKVKIPNLDGSSIAYFNKWKDYDENKINIIVKFKTDDVPSKINFASVVLNSEDSATSPPTEELFILADHILNERGGKENITEAPAGTFDNINGSTENVMYKMEDDYGMSYYLRGAKDYVNNNIIFAEHQWKIVRINGDGSIRIIYNGTCPNNSCIINTTGISTQIGESAFNTHISTAIWNTTYYYDNKYMGYMYGGAAGEASTSRMQATTNETSSTIKIYLDNWYLTNIQNKGYHSYISDTLFCNDRQLEGELEVVGYFTGTGFGTSNTAYAAPQRLANTKNPNIKCAQKNDRFTVSDTVKGNGALTYPIGLLTPDETAIAGLKFNASNFTNYLHTNQYWWTLGPGLWSVGIAYAVCVYSHGSLIIYNVSNGGGARGVLNLKSETQVTGTGTTSDPFKVV